VTAAPTDPSQPQSINGANADSNSRTPLLFWILSAALVLYVALCVGNRDIIPEADAWEHHRVIVTLSKELWNPGNPTYATADSSIRYSPYFLSQALFVRWTGIDAYHVLGFVAVLNTALLCFAVRGLMAAWGELRSTGVALLFMMSLYGIAPGYAGSFALADLPWHQVNPSAFAFALLLIALTQIKRISDRTTSPIAGWLIVAVGLILPLLDHAMTGAFGAMAAGLTAIYLRKSKLLIGAVVCVVIAVAVALAWPWYSFKEALTARRDVDYWFNHLILSYMFLYWCMPAMLLSVVSLFSRDRPAVRYLLLIGWSGMVFALISILLRSPTFARFPMPSTTFLQLAIAVMAYQFGVLSVSRWPAYVLAIARGGEDAVRPLLQFIVLAGLLYGLIPQAFAVITQPFLARHITSHFKTIQDQQLHLLPLYKEVLKNIGEKDVVMAQPVTAWPVPSVRGRIVSALHYELYTFDQPRRDVDVKEFFDPDPSDERRLELVQFYNAKWILIDERVTSQRLIDTLAQGQPIVERAGPFVLLRAPGN